jgi:hypothetical protein
VLKKRIERGKIGSVNRHCGRGGKLLFADNDFQNVGGVDRFPGGQEPPQCFVDEVKAFMLGGVQQLEILFDRGSFRRVLEQLIVGHSEPRRGVHVIRVFIVDEGTRLADQRVDHVAKVDRFLAVAELSRQLLDAFVPVPELQMILVNTNLQ